MGCKYAEKERECLKLSECGLKGMIYELGLGELNHKQSDKKIRNFKGVGVCFVGWCAYPFIVVFREVLIK